MSSREHSCTLCNKEWHCEGCETREVDKLCDECKDRVTKRLTDRELKGIETEAFSIGEETVISLVAELRELREVLKFYADETSYHRKVGPDEESWIDIDEGCLARMALKGK